MTGVQISKLCLFPNVKVGECMVEDKVSNIITKVACAKDAFKVEVVKDGTADESTCPDGTGGLGNKLRNKLLCISQVT